MRFICTGVFVAFALLPAIGFAQAPDKTLQGYQAPPLLVIDDARSQYRQGNRDETVRDLQASARLMRLEATAYPEPARAVVEGFAASIDDLAERLRKGQVKSSNELDRVVGMIAISKAEFHMGEANRVWATKDVKRTGYELLAASHALEHGLEWRGDQASSATMQALTKAKELAGELIDGTKRDAGTVDSALKAVEKEVANAAGRTR